MWRAPCSTIIAVVENLTERRIRRLALLELLSPPGNSKPQNLRH
jgi:hypothetical protein